MLNRKFYAWTVLEEVKTEKPGKWYECLCSCGNIRIKAGTELRAGKGRQCRECQYSRLYDPENEIGKRYGKWTIIKFKDIHRKLLRFEVQCDCGFKGLHCAADLRAGKSRQCTVCHNRENAENNKTHGMHGTKTYKIWSAMIHRCTNKNSTAYRYYGGRGIKVCKRWRTFKNFLEDMGEQPPGLTIDRINNNGGYKPSNCRWVTHKENCNNRGNSKKK